MLNLIEHNQLNQEARRLAQTTDKTSVVNAFVQSLSSRDLERRSALGSYAHIWSIQDHIYERIQGLYSPFCSYCGIDVSDSIKRHAADFETERKKFGGVRHGDLGYAIFDLTLFNRLEPAVPNERDWEILSSILKVSAKANTVGELHKSLANIFKSNKNERSMLFEILGYCGVLCPTDCPSYAQGFVQYKNRGDGDPRGDRKYPFSFWRGGQVNYEAAVFWFGEKCI